MKRLPSWIIIGCFLGVATPALAQRGRGGFDPSTFLSRLDVNDNGVIDVDEQQGPAKFMIARLQKYDPDIKEGQPIKLSKIVKTFEKARGDREGRGESSDRRGRRSGEDDDERTLGDQAVTVELLVPGFGDGEVEPEPVLGFGAHADLLTIDVTDADVQEAAKRMRYFDKNKDGVLTPDELSSQFAGNPMDFDRNRDGRLTRRELAVRYAVRREGVETAKQQRDRDDVDENDRSQGRAGDQVDLYNGRRSYRSKNTRSHPEGLPGYFTDRDANGDGQVAMAEYTDNWSDAMVAEFFAIDTDRDGIITSHEALTAVENGGDRPATTTTASREPMTRGSESEPAVVRKAGSRKATSAPSSSGVEPRMLKVANRIVKRNDANGDGLLTPAEWKEMLMSPAKADANRDGKVTAEEYALWMQSGRQ